MTGDMNMGLTFGDHLDAPGRELILDAADRDFVAGDLPRGKDHGVAGIEADRMRARCDSRERSALLPLSARRDDQDLVARQAHRSTGIDRFREVLEIAGCTRDR